MVIAANCGFTDTRLTHNLSAKSLLCLSNIKTYSLEAWGPFYLNSLKQNNFIALRKNVTDKAFWILYKFFIHSNLDVQNSY